MAREPNPAANRPATRQDLFALLDRIGVAHNTVAHAPVFTVAESAEIKRALPGGHTKNLFLKDKRGALSLLCALAETEIDLKATAALLGAGRFSFGAAELLFETLGVLPGSVTPFALINDRTERVSLILDEGLTQIDPVNFHPLENTATTAISPKGLVDFALATGHKPRIVRFRAGDQPRLVE